MLFSYTSMIVLNLLVRLWSHPLDDTITSRAGFENLSTYSSFE